VRQERQPTVEAICCADLQLADKPPIMRSGEADWLKVQGSYLEQLAAAQAKHKAPILLAGDLFDNWRASPLLLSHCIRWFRTLDVYAIPGNHDLPEHNYTQLERSGYWTLVEAGAIKHLTPGCTHGVGRLTVYSFPSGFPVLAPNRTNTDLSLHVALIHAYIWIKDHGHEKAPDEARWAPWQEKLRGYDAAVFGDNHKGFTVKLDGKVPILNCGTFMRRHADEKDYRPSLGLLWSNGRFTREPLDCSADSFLEVEGLEKALERTLQMDFDGLAAELSLLHAEKRNYASIVRHVLEKERVDPETKSIVLRALGALRGK
jgi:hypothetical protein